MEISDINVGDRVRVTHRGGTSILIAEFDVTAVLDNVWVEGEGMAFCFTNKDYLFEMVEEGPLLAVAAILEHGFEEGSTFEEQAGAFLGRLGDYDWKMVRSVE